MSDPFIAEIRIFPFNFAPVGWAFCNGQLLPISQNTALFSLLGTTYGGDGRTTFALPNFQGIAPLAPGQGPGLSFYALGQTGGEQSVTLLTTEIPGHTHSVNALASAGDQSSPANTAWAQTSSEDTKTDIEPPEASRDRWWKDENTTQPKPNPEPPEANKDRWWAEDSSNSQGVKIYTQNIASNVALNPQAFAPAGGSQPHNNLPPYLTLNFCIALQGVYPQRS